MPHSADIVFIGLSISSSWGNGHATTYRALLHGLHTRGHRVLFLEQDQPWYAQHRDAPALPYCRTELYVDTNDLRRRFRDAIRTADAVVVGSYVPHGREVIDWVLTQASGIRAFYDIDTPVTLAKLAADSCDYLAATHIGHFDLMLSFSGGAALQRLEHEFCARRARALYCSVDLKQHRPRKLPKTLDLGYLGTYSADRQPGLELLMNRPARQLPDANFAVVGAQYPAELCWPHNVARVDHLPPQQHADFYARQRFTLNLTRADMRAAGHSPSVRLFEAAACGTPIISDVWLGIEEIFRPGEEILLADTADDIITYLTHIDAPESERMSQRARERVLCEHSGERRAAQLERYFAEANSPTVARATSMPRPGSADACASATH